MWSPCLLLRRDSHVWDKNSYGVSVCVVIRCPLSMLNASHSWLRRWILGRALDGITYFECKLNWTNRMWGAWRAHRRDSRRITLANGWTIRSWPIRSTSECQWVFLALSSNIGCATVANDIRDVIAAKHTIWFRSECSLSGLTAKPICVEQFFLVFFHDRNNDGVADLETVTQTQRRSCPLHHRQWHFRLNGSWPKLMDRCRWWIVD